MDWKKPGSLGFPVFSVFSVLLLVEKLGMAKDKFHDNVRKALEKDGWTITEDPYFLMVGRRRGFIDLGAGVISCDTPVVL